MMERKEKKIKSYEAMTKGELLDEIRRMWLKISFPVKMYHYFDIPDKKTTKLVLIKFLYHQREIEKILEGEHE